MLRLRSVKGIRWLSIVEALNPTNDFGLQLCSGEKLTKQKNATDELRSRFHSPYKVSNR